VVLEGVFCVPRTSARPLVFVVLLAVMVLLLGCGGAPGSSGGSTPITRRQADSSLEAWPKAEAEMRKTAEDAVLLGVGTSGLALADVPDSWSFSFFSPTKNHIYSVSVEHGKAEAPRDLGAARPDTTVSAATEIASIKVGAAQAVVKAREFGEKSATVPKNVVVAGSFAKSPQLAALGIKTGVWTVTFASGTDMADAQKYEVDMMSGAVTALKN
jgi:hypothetical protein